MAKVYTSISLDEDLQAKAQKLFAECGLDLSTAINIFLSQSVRENGIPFRIGLEIPNEDTLAAMKEVDEMSKHPEQYKRYHSFSELLEEIGAEDVSLAYWNA